MWPGGSLNIKMLSYHYRDLHIKDKIDGLVQERCNSIANALELHISCTNSSRWSCDRRMFNMGIPVPEKTVFTLRRAPGHQQLHGELWMQISLALGHLQPQYIITEHADALVPHHYRASACTMTSIWLSARMWYLHCFSIGDTTDLP